MLDCMKKIIHTLKNFIVLACAVKFKWNLIVNVLKVLKPSRQHTPCTCAVNF